ncbi:MAG TPA: TPM domain-containing protein [Xanthobacteraceae bacterium]
MCGRRLRSSPGYGSYSPFGLVIALLLFVTGAAAAAIQFPPLTGRVVDQANVIPAQNRSALDGKLKELEDKSGIQLVVATVSSLQGNDIETFANELFRYWKLGEAKKNNGVLLLVAPAERKVRIEVGYGLEGTLTDALSNVIITGAIIPRFKANDYSGGIDRGVDGIISVLTTDAADWKPRTGVRTDEGQSLLDQLMPLILIVLFILILRAMTRNARQGPSGRWGSRGGPVIFIPPGGSGWGGGGSSGTSWGGGGGGFSGGGGSSGGGGASGSW